MALTQTEINEVINQLQPIIAKALNESTSIQQAQANIQQGVTQYIGARYVPLFADPIEWDNTRAYEPLTIVLHQGNSYTTRQYTPVGIDIANDAFWACTGNYNVQLELYRQEVNSVKSIVNLIKYSFDTVADMKKAKPVANTTVETKGYHATNDGGGGVYDLVTGVATNPYTEIQLSDTIVAKLRYNNEVKLDCLGIKHSSEYDCYDAYVFACSLNPSAIIFGANKYYFTKVPLFSEISLLGSEHEKTEIYALGSNYSYFIYMNWQVIQKMTIKNLVIKGTNTGQMCFDFTPRNITDTKTGGGVWDCTFENIRIIGFDGYSIYLNGDDIIRQDGTMDVAVQSVNFINVVCQSSTGTLLKATGQNDTIYWRQCNFSSLVNNDPPNPYNLVDIDGDHYFVQCRFISGKYAIEFHTGVFTFDNCWFELNTQGIIYRNNVIPDYYIPVVFTNCFFTNAKLPVFANVNTYRTEITIEGGRPAGFVTLASGTQNYRINIQNATNITYDNFTDLTGYTDVASMYAQGNLREQALQGTFTKISETCDGMPFFATGEIKLTDSCIGYDKDITIPALTHFTMVRTGKYWGIIYA